MKSKYYPPAHLEKKFHCILCNVYAEQSWFDLRIHTPGHVIGTKIDTSYCSHCNEWTFWHDAKMIIPPEAPVEPPHPDLPEDCRTEFNEARDIFSRSPRAAAALLRLCIQKVMPHLGEKGKSINDDIASLVAKGLPSLVQKALDYCRVVGNNAVHPGEIEINDTPEIAQKLFQMINFIVEDRITRPKEIEGLYLQLPDTARQAIDERDKKAKPPKPESKGSP